MRDLTFREFECHTASKWQSSRFSVLSNSKFILLNHLAILELSKYKIQPSFVSQKTKHNIDLSAKKLDRK